MAADAQQNKPFRVRTITAFLQLPPDVGKWEGELAAAGAFLGLAQQHLESLGYEVQTVRIATQPFPEFLAASGSSPTCSSPQQLSQVQVERSTSVEDLLVSNAVLLERLAAHHGIPLVSLGSSSDPQHLRIIPGIIAATNSTSCTFALPADQDWGLALEVSAAIMQVARHTDGMGNFRFGSASNMQPGIPYFPVACCGGPQQHRTFAIGTESDALLHQAFSQAASAAAAAAGHDGCLQDSREGNAAVSGAAAAPPAGGSGCRKNVLQLAQQQLHEVLLQHWEPLEAAALEIQQLSAQHSLQHTSVTQMAGTAAVGANNNRSDSTQSSTVAQHELSMGKIGGDESSPPVAEFTYLGLDTSLAPGLDTPALTASYQLLLQSLQPAAGPNNHFSRSDSGEGCHEPAAVVTGGFGGPGSLTISSMITRVLKQLPLRLTGYCGLMLAVCEDQGLAAAAAAGTMTISQLLQYSAVCGCGLDTVPVPGPTRTHHQQHNHQLQDEQEVVGAQLLCGRASAGAQDAATTAAIAGLVSDVNTLAYRLNKPLACRLLPLPGKVAGQPTGFDHPFMINSCVMHLHK